ncbi:hypothetical protein M407DRAFT_29277 [Tulasnella calospora MUT 4182]|uniref:Protein kinase domain-containing protein n=1 Tax=Tulasnella calospora MUT 4182 TaxID=1051891 RepID=A0A0C3LI48_9AGAM|nr:hypothetical protein M407DRAFT_29277 [Tulasnella calospora MUT 4182]
MVDQQSRGDSKDLEEAIIDQVEQAMNRLTISPRNVLESLVHLRVEKARIKPLDNSEAPKGGGTADVEAAMLAPAQPTNISESDDTEYVAVKKLRFDTETNDDRALAPFAHEINLLNDLDHPNVVEIVGFVEDVVQGVAWMVFRWEKNGNLREFVRSANWELPERVCLIYDVASGLNYLHGRNPPICHGDLKSLNILVNLDNRAVITDFGSARAVDPATGVHTTTVTERQDQTATTAPEMERLKVEIAASGESITMTGPAWTVRWAAPELLRGELPGLPSDIWAFGWICWEAITGNFPFEEENDVGVVLRVMKSDLPAIGDNTQLKQIRMLCSLMEECLILGPNERPPAVRCQQVISYMELAVPSHSGGNSSAAARSSRVLFALGQIELRNGVLDEARRYFEQSLEVARSLGDKNDESRALRGLGDTFGRQGENSKAGEAYIEACDISSQIGDRLGLARSLGCLGIVHAMRNDYSKAEESYIQSRDIFSQMGDQRGVARSLIALGDMYCLRCEYSKAEQSYIQARDIFSQIGNQRGFAQSTQALGHVYRVRGEYSKAEESYAQARDIYSQIGNQLGFARSIQYLGDMGLIRREFSKAKERYSQAHDIYSQMGSQFDLAASVLGLGEVYLKREEYFKAEDSYIQARDIFSEIGEKRGFAKSLKGLGDVYHTCEEHSKAQESYLHARTIFSEVGDQLGFAHSVQGLGHVHTGRGEYAKAEESYLEAQQIYRRIGDMGSLAGSLWHLGRLHREQSQYEDAQRLVREASALYGDFGLERDVEKCNNFLDRIRQLMDN